MIAVMDPPENRDDLSAVAAFAEPATPSNPASQRLELGGEDAKKGLGKLALAIIELLHQLLERQALRRLDEGTITEEQLERVGEGLLRQSEALDELCEEFGVERSELNLDLGPLGQLL